MTSVSTGGRVSLSWQLLRVAQVIDREDDKALDSHHVTALQASFARLGGQLQLQPIVVDSMLRLIDGAHRLEAARRARWAFIAAVVVSDPHGVDRSLLEAEANRVRRSLGVLELEELWRTHYEPELRDAAHGRKLAALRQHERPMLHPSAAAEDRGRSSIAPVLGNSNNGSEGQAESLSRAARRITGLSLSTLNKIAQIRELASAVEAPDEIRRAAAAGLTKLATNRVSVEFVYRAIRNLQARTDGASADPESASLQADELALERVLAESSWLAERLDGPLSGQLVAAARRSEVSREMLRGVGVSLAHSLAEVEAIERRLGVACRQA